ncbi:type II toxin-antitoxin system VapC family toxin [Conexibacter woesei]|uniref:Ribonuclease VapC n=1 Tax=Conexibacter woesei (strain DSM 14684 / CCUG 47730 / CIP 108061 / JCM 11494 / NBRC 100937 / ID131577) TaxID=469383 RepID=D3FB40_CONWI|nr:type II toxin-antitoxin system VapC family toxin [Conexibacter woesei]ADB53232.1 PilT protein domain protein [Conexibacter woesei DSM 14684]
MSRALADTSVFVAQESGRTLGELPDRIAVSVVTAAELELGVLRARDAATRARRLNTLARVRSAYPLLPIDAETASCFAGIADEELGQGRRLRRHDVWIAATALRHGVPVVTQDADFTAFDLVTVLRV